MIRGIRGATTVLHNEEKEMLKNAKELAQEIVLKNNVKPENISHVFLSVTNDLNATFPAKSLRELPGWSYVPVMCMSEIDVPGGLKKCIRIMMVVNTKNEQEDIKHIFLNEAVKLRPDLVQGE